MFTLEQICSAVVNSLTDDLKREKYKLGDSITGHCYVASETLYHLYKAIGDKQYILDSRFIVWEIEPHWFLVAVKIKTWERHVVDLTASQFTETPDYARASVRFFMTPTISKRSQVVFERAKKLLENHLTNDRK